MSFVPSPPNPPPQLQHAGGERLPHPLHCLNYVITCTYLSLKSCCSTEPILRIISSKDLYMYNEIYIIDMSL